LTTKPDCLLKKTGECEKIASLPLKVFPSDPSKNKSAFAVTNE